ncbi:hypothetical protein C8Q72DRAFT_954587 [Fomitopsis betulina]|nr:hypothetical protein C8Q72DRAFT_954587 [Fomitopsis betulina]
MQSRRPLTIVSARSRSRSVPHPTPALYAVATQTKRATLSIVKIMNGVEDLLNNTLGCLYLVGVFSVILYGCTCGQVLYYATHYIPEQKGKVYVTVLVALLWVLDTAKTLVDLACGWDLIVLKRGNALSLLYKIPATLPGDYAASCSAVYVVQCCYLHTIWNFIKQSDRRHYWAWFMAPAVLLATISFVTGIIAGMQVQDAGSISNALPNSHIAGSLRPACSAVVDIYITVWLCYHLQDAKSPQTVTRPTRSDYRLAKLVNYAITRGIVTSVVQIAGFALFLIDYRNETLWFMLCYISASTIYVNSLLAMWNARHHIQDANPQASTSSQIDSEVELPPEVD